MPNQLVHASVGRRQKCVLFPGTTGSFRIPRAVSFLHISHHMDHKQGVEWKNQSLGFRQTWIQILAVPLPSCVSLDNFLNFSESQCLYQ